MNRQHVVNWSNEIDSDSIDKNSVDKFKEFYAKELRNLQAAEKAFRNLVVLLLRNQNGLEEPKITSRIKDRDECIKKFFEKYRDSTPIHERCMDIKSRITDLIGLRVTCIYESDIDVVKDRLLKHFDKIGLTNKTKDLEEDDDRFGYKGVHLDLRLNEDRKALPEYRPFDGVCFEIQIRTIVQDAWSEVDHKLKYKRQIPNKLKRRINRLSALFELADQEFEAIRRMTTDLEAEALEQSPNGLLANEEILNSINASKIIKNHFSDFSPNPNTIEDFVEEIIRLKPGINSKLFNDYIHLNIDTVNNFVKYCFEKNETTFAPYTVIRHCLYMASPQNFQEMLLKRQLSNFDDWREFGTTDQKEIEDFKARKNIVRTHGLSDFDDVEAIVN